MRTPLPIRIIAAFALIVFGIYKMGTIDRQRAFWSRWFPQEARFGRVYVFFRYSLTGPLFIALGVAVLIAAVVER
jgi:hypothetical protein